MTQAELGAALSWGDKGANRLAQYKTNYRVPRKDLVRLPETNLLNGKLTGLKPVMIVGNGCRQNSGGNQMNRT